MSASFPGYHWWIRWSSQKSKQQYRDHLVGQLTTDEYASALSFEGDDVQCLEVLVSGSPLMFKQGLSNIHENI